VLVNSRLAANSQAIRCGVPLPVACEDELSLYFPSPASMIAFACASESKPVPRRQATSVRSVPLREMPISWRWTALSSLTHRIDVFARESLAIEVGQSLKGGSVWRTEPHGLATGGAKKLFVTTARSSPPGDGLMGVSLRSRIDFSDRKADRHAYVESFQRDGSGRSAWTRTGSIHSHKRKRSSKLGEGNISESRPHRATGRGPHTKSLCEFAASREFTKHNNCRRLTLRMKQKKGVRSVAD